VLLVDIHILRFQEVREIYNELKSIWSCNGSLYVCVREGRMLIFNNGLRLVRIVWSCNGFSRVMRASNLHNYITLEFSELMQLKFVQRIYFIENNDRSLKSRLNSR